MPWAAVAGSIGSALLGSSSAKSAAKEQKEAADKAINEQKFQQDRARADLAPWRLAGSNAVGTLGMLLGLNNTAAGMVDAPGPEPKDGKGRGVQRVHDEWQARNDAYNAQQAAAQTGTQDPRFGSLNQKFTLADFWDDPVTKASYQQGLDQGTKALANTAGARGNRNSGAQLKALDRFATDYTGNQAAGSYNRFYGDQDRTFNRLSGVAGTGQTATTNTAQLGANTGNTIGNLLAGVGNARGAAAIAGGNAWGGASQNIGNTLSNYFNANRPPSTNGNYNSAGVFQPYYSGYDSSGGYAYG